MLLLLLLESVGSACWPFWPSAAPGGGERGTALWLLKNFECLNLFLCSPAPVFRHKSRTRGQEQKKSVKNSIVPGFLAKAFQKTKAIFENHMHFPSVVRFFNLNFQKLTNSVELSTKNDIF